MILCESSTSLDCKSHSELAYCRRLLDIDDISSMLQDDTCVLTVTRPVLICLQIGQAHGACK